MWCAFSLGSFHRTWRIKPRQSGEFKRCPGKEFLGQTIVMLKDNWYAQPNDKLNPRITIATDHAPATETALRERGVVIADPVQAYEDGFYVGSFLDSEGNKLWFCSPWRNRG